MPVSGTAARLRALLRIRIRFDRRRARCIWCTLWLHGRGCCSRPVRRLLLFRRPRRRKKYSNLIQYTVMLSLSYEYEYM